MQNTDGPSDKIQKIRDKKWTINNKDKKKCRATILIKKRNQQLILIFDQAVS